MMLTKNDVEELRKKPLGLRKGCRLSQNYYYA